MAVEDEFFLKVWVDCLQNGKLMHDCWREMRWNLCHMSLASFISVFHKMVQLAELITLASSFWCLQDSSKCTCTLINFDKCTTSKISPTLKEWQVIGLHPVDNMTTPGYKKLSSCSLRRNRIRHQKKTFEVGQKTNWLMATRNPANSPVDMVNILLFTGFYTSQVVVWDFWKIKSMEEVVWFSYSQIHPIQCSNYFHLSSSNRDDVGQGKVWIFDLLDWWHLMQPPLPWCGISLIKYDEILEKLKCTCPKVLGWHMLTFVGGFKNV